MEELIKQIIGIEEKAQEVVRDAREASGELAERVKNDTQRMRSDIEHKTQDKNESLRRGEEQTAAKKIAAINAETEKHMSALEERYRENKDKWVEQIVSGISAL